MAGRSSTREHQSPLSLAASAAGLVLSLLLVALATLTPEGSGWQWGSPVAELCWYAHGLGSPATMLQLVGNLALLATSAAFAVVRWPRLGRLPLLAVVALASGTAIEALQWALPLGRVVSPVDALLNATGAVVAGALTAHLRRTQAGAWGGRAGSTASTGASGSSRASAR